MAKEEITIGKHKIKVNKIKKKKKKDKGNKTALELVGDRNWVFDISKTHPLHDHYVKEYEDNIKEKKPKKPKIKKVKNDK